MEQLPNFSEQRVRDLAWAVFGPNLIDDFSPFRHGQGIDSFCVDLTRQRIEWLRQLDRDPSPLLSALSSLKSTRLGLYFEALWQFFLRQDPHYRLIAANLPVFDQQRTLGEFDLLLRDEAAGQIIHLELASKYYLDRPDAGSGPFANWVGPNAQDRLDLKLNHLLTHQTRLSASPQGKLALSPFTDDAVRQCVALKGWLFYRHSDSVTAHTGEAGPEHLAPSHLAPAHNRGIWMPYTEIEQQADSADCWHILQRPHWLSPAYFENYPGDEHKIISPGALAGVMAAHFGQGQIRPLMLCSLKREGENLCERSRYMITGTDWPRDQVS